MSYTLPEYMHSFSESFLRNSALKEKKEKKTTHRNLGFCLLHTFKLVPEKGYLGL